MLKELNSCTKFMYLMYSTRTIVNGEEISCYEIFKIMLQLENKIYWQGGPLEAKFALPLHSLDRFAVNNPNKLVFFGIFLPITKWTDF